MDKCYTTLTMFLASFSSQVNEKAETKFAGFAWNSNQLGESSWDCITDIKNKYYSEIKKA